MSSRNVIVVDDELAMAVTVQQILTREGYAVTTLDRAAALAARLQGAAPEVLLLDLRLPDGSGMDLLEQVSVAWPGTAVIMVTGFATVEAAVEAMKKGAADFLAKPFPPDELVLKVARVLEVRRLRDENATLRRQLGAHSPALVGESPGMREVRATIERLNDSDCRVLITGESGVGKEVVARALHATGVRREAAFSPVNCVALAETLLESELFGHERGAFTGAVSTRRGLFEIARGGTLFLDEIAETTPIFQAKLLRVVEAGEFRRVGSERYLHADVRLIASTNRDLRRAMATGTFREDLFYRLSVVHIPIPPLRDRAEDIPLLLDHFVRVQAYRMKKVVPELDRTAVSALVRYPWPGNVRELENMVERAIILSSGARLTAADFPCLDGAPRRPPGGNGRTLEDLERELIERTLVDLNWNKTGTAHRLGISRRALYDKAHRLGIALDPRDLP